GWTPEDILSYARPKRLLATDELR
nr:hypothetical protein [Tanacetum cinerariifolium]GFB83763.1 hypothetical protein [Tanacetum cinerariifolium]